MITVFTMKKILILVSVGWLLSGCAEEQVASSHPDNWTDPASDDSHMAKIIDRGIDGCQACHGGDGNDYFGGTSGVSCYSCHEGGPSGHPAWGVWMSDTTSAQFHGTVAGSVSSSACAACHEIGQPVGDSGHYCSNCH